MFPGVGRVHLLWSLREGFWDPPGVFSLSRISCTPNPWASTWPLGWGQVGDTFSQRAVSTPEGPSLSPWGVPMAEITKPTLHVLAPQ